MSNNIYSCIRYIEFSHNSIPHSQSNSTTGTFIHVQLRISSGSIALNPWYYYSSGSNCRIEDDPYLQPSLDPRPPGAFDRRIHGAHGIIQTTYFLVEGIRISTGVRVFLRIATQSTRVQEYKSRSWWCYGRCILHNYINTT